MSTFMMTIILTIYVQVKKKFKLIELNTVFKNQNVKDFIISKNIKI